MSQSHAAQIASTAHIEERTRWPFQNRVDQVAGKRFDAEIEAGVSGRRDREGVKPRLPLSMIYHNVRRAGLWKEAGAARVAFVGRLVTDGIPKKAANTLAWRLIEDALYYCEGEGGFDSSILAAEFEAMTAYGEERKYPAVPSEAEIAAALHDRGLLFPSGYYGTRLPTTVMHFYKRLGLWDLAARLLGRLDPDRGELGERSGGGAWRILGRLLTDSATLAELRDALRPYLHDEAGPVRPK